MSEVENGADDTTSLLGINFADAGGTDFPFASSVFGPVLLGALNRPVGRQTFFLFSSSSCFTLFSSSSCAIKANRFSSSSLFFPEILCSIKLTFLFCLYGGFLFLLLFLFQT